VNDTENVFEKSILLNITVAMPGSSRKIEADSVVETDADHDWLSVSKRLFESKEFDKVRTVVGRMKRYLERKCVVPKGKAGDKPALRRFLKSGVYVLPLALVAEVDEAINNFKAEFELAKQEFLSVYPTLRESAKEKLKGLFNDTDYPDQETLNRAFYVDSSYLNVSTPVALTRISSEIFKREQEQAKEKWAEASLEIRQVLRSGFAGLVDWMVSTLTPTDGRKKQFRGSTAERLLEFLSDFEGKNLTSDAELGDLVSRAKGILEGQDVESLQRAAKDDEFRANTAKAFAEIKEALDPLVESQASRMIDLPD
jgi:hypothetical protein